MSKESDALLLKSALGQVSQQPQQIMVNIQAPDGTTTPVPIEVANLNQLARIAAALEFIAAQFAEVQVILGNKESEEDPNDAYAPVDEAGSGYPKDVVSETTTEGVTDDPALD